MISFSVGLPHNRPKLPALCPCFSYEEFRACGRLIFCHALMWSSPRSGRRSLIWGEGGGPYAMKNLRETLTSSESDPYRICPSGGAVLTCQVCDGPPFSWSHPLHHPPLLPTLSGQGSLLFLCSQRSRFTSSFVHIALPCVVP